jgi:hypothetical protein
MTTTIGAAVVNIVEDAHACSNEFGAGTKMDEINIRSTSLRSADADPITLRETTTGRLVFMPAIVGIGMSDTGVRGTLLYQKKKPSGMWEDYTPIPLSSLKDGQGVKLELKSAETRLLFEKLSDLYSIAEEHGVPMGDQTFVRAPSSDLLYQLLQDGELDRVLNQSQGADLLKNFLVWLTRNAPSLAATLEDLDPSELINFDSAVGAARMKLLLREYDENQENKDEGYWQGFFERHSWVLSQVCNQPILIIRGQAYVGGKNIGNKDGNVVDFLYGNAITKNATLVEIKTPAADLLAPGKYRNRTHRPSVELSGAAQQLLNDRLSLIREYDALTRGEEETHFRTFSPRLVLVIGDASREFSTDSERQSFELYRGNLRDVDVVTFDELRKKVGTLIDLLEGRPRRRRGA